MSAPRPTTMSLTSRLFLAIATIVIAGGILVTLLAWTYGQRAAQNAFDRLLRGAGEQISAAISLSEGELLVDLPITAFDLLALSVNDRLVYRVATQSGQSLTGYQELAIPEFEDNIYFYEGEITGEAARFVAVRRNFAERDFSGSTITIVGHTLNARNALAWDILQNAWIILGLAGIAMTAISIFAVNSALVPLRRIGQHLHERSPEDLSAINFPVPSELSAFVASFNRFTGRLERQMKVMQDLIADSAHQLRTPIAALSAQIGNRMEEKLGQPEKTSLEKLQKQTQGLTRLTDQLLNRAMVIHRADASQLVEVDLREVAIEAVESFDGLVPSGQSLRLDLPETQVLILGDAPSLVEATKNLISNAIRHGGARREVFVGLRDGAATIAVRDEGDGITALQWRAYARRFSMQNGRKQVGGLGLSIVRSVVMAHGGTVNIGKTKNGRFEVALQFAPLAKNESATAHE